MDEKPHDELLILMSKAPENHLDNDMCDKIGKLVGKEPIEVVEGLLAVVHESARYSLASDFVMVVLEGHIRNICDVNKLDYDKEYDKSVELFKKTLK